MAKNEKYFNNWFNVLFGSEQEVAMDNRLYNIASFGVFALMIAFFIIYTVIGVHGARILLLLLVLIIEGCFTIGRALKKSMRKALL